MPYRFVLDRTDIDGGENTVTEIVQRAMTIDVGLAETTLAVCQLAAPQAQVTLGGAIGVTGLQPGFNQSVLLVIVDFVPQFVSIFGIGERFGDYSVFCGCWVRELMCFGLDSVVVSRSNTHPKMAG